MTGAAIPCGPLSGDVANKLSWFIKASQVECMSPTVDELQASMLATSLLMRVPDYRVMSSSIVETEYKDGLAAYAAGHYVEALGSPRGSGTSQTIALVTSQWFSPLPAGRMGACLFSPHNSR
jgi:hypothetical protein